MKQSQAEILSINLNEMMNERGAIGLKLMRNKRMIDDELQEYYQFKEELFKKYGEGKKFIDPESENGKLFLEEVMPIAEMEVNFDFRKITEDELAQSNLTANQMAVIWEWMVDDGNS